MNNTKLSNNVYISKMLSLRKKSCLYKTFLASGKKNTVFPVEMRNYLFFYFTTDDLEK